MMEDKRITCRAYTREFGEDAPEIRDWAWGAAGDGAGGIADTAADNA
jgi:hypothetical protein